MTDHVLKLNVIDYVDYVIAQFAFRINTIRTDNNQVFRAKFHRHLKDTQFNSYC